MSVRTTKNSNWVNRVTINMFSFRLRQHSQYRKQCQHYPTIISGLCLHKNNNNISFKISGNIRNIGLLFPPTHPPPHTAHMVERCWRCPGGARSPWCCWGCGCLWSPAVSAGSFLQIQTPAEACSCDRWRPQRSPTASAPHLASVLTCKRVNKEVKVLWIQFRRTSVRFESGSFRAPFTVR